MCVLLAVANLAASITHGYPFASIGAWVAGGYGALRPRRSLVVTSHGVDVMHLSRWTGRQVRVLRHLERGEARLSDDKRSIDLPGERIILFRRSLADAPEALAAAGIGSRLPQRWSANARTGWEPSTF
jgi:hypothetical protein